MTTWHITLSILPCYLYVYPIYEGSMVGIGTDIARSEIPSWIKARRERGDVVVELKEG
jgi:hypothetical protein